MTASRRGRSDPPAGVEPGVEAGADSLSARAAEARLAGSRPGVTGRGADPAGRGAGPAARAGIDVSQSVVVATARLAAREVKGVLRLGRGGSPIRRLLRPSRAVEISPGSHGLALRLVVVARAGQPLGEVGRAVALAVRGAVERVLGLEVETVTVVVDGVAG